MARDFNGSTDHGRSTAVVVTGPPFTMAGWVIPTNTGSNQIVMGLTDWDTAWNCHYISINTDATAIAAVTAEDVSFTGSGASGLTAGVFNHIGGVWASTTSRVPYVNGVVGTEDTTLKAPDDISDFTAGAMGTGSSWQAPTNGVIAELGLWNVALTAGEMASLANGTSPLLIRRANLVRYHRFVGRRSPEPDEINGNALTLTGTTRAEHSRIIMPQRVKTFMPPPITFHPAWAKNANPLIIGGAM